MQQELSDFLLAQVGKEDCPIATINTNKEGYFNITYYTHWHNDSNIALFSFLCEPQYAPQVASLVLMARDRGINGTQHWNLKALLDGNMYYPNLTKIFFPLNTEKNHNRIIVCYQDWTEENGALGFLLDRCPYLHTLTAPSAPNAHFFEREQHPLQFLHLQTGYNHQNFIRNLAESRCFPSLNFLHLKDYAETYMDNYTQYCTPYEDYEWLMTCLRNALPALRKIELESTVLSSEQKTVLQGLAQEQDVLLVFV